MKRAVGLAVAAVVAVLVPSCASERTPERADARESLTALRARFPGVLRSGSSAPPFEIPADARGAIVLRDGATGIGARVSLDGAKPSVRADVDGLAVFPEAGVVIRPSEHGVEDFVSLAHAPPGEELTYTLTPTGGAALRLVSRAIELLDEHGAPRVRMEAPYVVDATGAKLEASVAIEGCAYDASPVAPWGRPITPPGASSCTIRLRWSGAAYPALVDPSWTTTGALPSARDLHVAVKLADGKVLVTYGESCAGGCLLASSAGFLYDPGTRTFGSTGSANAKVTNTSAALLGNGKALVMSPSGALLYNPGTGLFDPAGTSTVTRSGGSTLTVLAGGKVLAAGGAGTSAEIYDPTTDKFTLTTTTMTASRSGHTATLLVGGKVLLAGGGSNTAELYDPVGDAFAATGSMSVSRSGHDAARLANGKVLVASGGTAVVELYDPATGNFTTTGPLADARSAATVTALSSGSVYVVGGYLGATASQVVERYDPATGQFGPAPFLLTPRASHRATLLDSGAVLVTGGRDITNDSSAVSISQSEELGVAGAGGSCKIHDDCASGICDLGVCCLAACGDTCKSCVVGTGQCQPVLSADDPSSCTGASTCDATGACKKKKGQACAASTDCASGHCVDGFCCDRACDGACEACDGVTPGTCGAVAGKPHGARTCASDGSACGGLCDGRNATSCAFPGGETGCGTTCAEGVRTANACDGKGACVSQGSRACPGNFACADAQACRTTCSADADCARGYACTAGKCTPSAYCDGDHTVIAADGKSKTDCTPFRCDTQTNRCRTTCEDVAGCADPFVCSLDGQCVAPPRAPSGCSASPGRRGSGGALALIVAALVALRSRRLRARRSSVG